MQIIKLCVYVAVGTIKAVVADVFLLWRNRNSTIKDEEDDLLLPFLLFIATLGRCGRGEEWDEPPRHQQQTPSEAVIELQSHPLAGVSAGAGALAEPLVDKRKNSLYFFRREG